MINFTVGPVQASEKVREIAREQIPYFRTPEFSELMLENEKLIKKFAGAKENSRVVFITGSGTASMEAAVTNLFNENDNVLVVNGGGFGQRFVNLCKIHDIKYTEIKIPFGETLTKEMLMEYENGGFTGFLVNVHETSTGEHYNIDLISDFCKKNNIFLLVDAISSFLADELDMKQLSIGAMITGSQKALACPPGISIIVLSNEAIEKVENNDPKCMYFDLKDALKNGERGQTPFTPAVGILIQINKRLKEIEKNGGEKAEIQRVKELAEYFRDNIKDLPLDIVSKNPSNAVTAVHPHKNNASEIFNVLKDEYKIWICPNGGELKEKIFRVGHIGYLTKDDYNILIDALKELNSKGIL